MSPAPPPSPFPWFDVVIILFLVALNGVFAMSELAIVSAREARLKAMAKADGPVPRPRSISPPIPAGFCRRSRSASH